MCTGGAGACTFLVTSLFEKVGVCLPLPFHDLVERELLNVHFLSHLIPHSLLVLLRSTLFAMPPTLYQPIISIKLPPPLAHAHQRNYALDENLLCGAYLCVRSPHLTGWG